MHTEYFHITTSTGYHHYYQKIQSKRGDEHQITKCKAVHYQISLNINMKSYGNKEMI